MQLSPAPQGRKQMGTAFLHGRATIRLHSQRRGAQRMGTQHPSRPCPAIFDYVQDAAKNLLTNFRWIDHAMLGGGNDALRQGGLHAVEVALFTTCCCSEHGFTVREQGWRTAHL